MKNAGSLALTVVKTGSGSDPDPVTFRGSGRRTGSFPDPPSLPLCMFHPGVFPNRSVSAHWHWQAAVIVQTPGTPAGMGDPVGITGSSKIYRIRILPDSFLTLL